MTLTPDDLARIEARVNAATEGPWFVIPGANSYCYDNRIGPGDDADSVAFSDGPDGHFIASARQDIPALITALKEAWAENERLKNEVIAGFDAGLDAAAEYVLRIGSYGSDHTAEEIRFLSMPEDTAGGKP